MLCRIFFYRKILQIVKLQFDLLSKNIILLFCIMTDQVDNLTVILLSEVKTRFSVIDLSVLSFTKQRNHTFPPQLY